MQTTGQVKSIVQDIETGKLIVSFVIDSPHVELSGGDTLDITATRHKEKRSLNANSYFHKLVQLIAAAVGSSNTEVKNRLIREYGAFLYEDDGNIPTYSVKFKYAEKVLNYENMHFKPIGFEGEFVKMALMKGSHLYSTIEMSRLIDGTVSEAKELGIETMTPAELERLKAGWNTGQKNV